MERARTVAVVVPSPATSDVLLATSLTICAPMFSNLSSSSISLATVTPSFVILGDPQDFSRRTFRPFGPRVTFTALARMSTPFIIFSLAFAPYRISFAAIALTLLQSLFHDGQDVILSHDEMFHPVDVNFIARVLTEKYALILLDFHWDPFPVFIPFTGTHGYDLPLLRFFLGRVRDDDPAAGLLLLLDPENK